VGGGGEPNPAASIAPQSRPERSAPVFQGTKRDQEVSSGNCPSALRMALAAASYCVIPGGMAISSSSVPPIPEALSSHFPKVHSRWSYNLMHCRLGRIKRDMYHLHTWRRFALPAAPVRPIEPPTKRAANRTALKLVHRIIAGNSRRSHSDTVTITDRHQLQRIGRSPRTLQSAIALPLPA
jgi:hypothetical protein